MNQKLTQKSKFKLFVGREMAFTAASLVFPVASTTDCASCTQEKLEYFGP